MSINKKNSRKGSWRDLWERYNFKWVVLISIWTFFLAVSINIAAEVILSNLEISFAFLVLFIIIAVGVMSDIVGIAVTAASEKPFHAMAANRVAGAKHAIRLLKNAGPVSNFCNDVIGDICGIVSGAAGVSIVIQIYRTPLPISRTLFTILLSGVVASFTVGGKAIGKGIAMHHAQGIVFNTARFLYFIEERFGIAIVPERRKKKTN